MVKNWIADSHDDWHVMPLGDFRSHVDSRNCWCQPSEIEPNLIVHNSMDRREHTIEKGVTQ